MNELKKDQTNFPASQRNTVEVTVVSTDGKEHTTRVRLYDLGNAKAPTYPPSKKIAVNE